MNKKTFFLFVVIILLPLASMARTTNSNSRNVPAEVPASSATSTLNDLDVLKPSDDSTEATSLNPQPEPPAQMNELSTPPVRMDETIGVDAVSVDDLGQINDESLPAALMVTTPTQTEGTNPQPKLPITKLMEFKNKLENLPDGDDSVKVYLQETPSSTVQTVEIIPADKSLAARFEHNKNQITMPIRAPFSVENGKIILNDESATYTLKLQPPSFYSSIKKGVETLGLSSNAIANVELAVENKKSVYNVAINEKGKLFGFIPLKIQSVAQFAADTNSFIFTKRPWYTKVVYQLADYGKIKFLPNLVMTDIRFEPAQFSAFDKVRIIGTVTNEGTDSALGSPPIMGGGGGPTAVLTITGYTHQWYFVFMALEPGESYEYGFDWNEAFCGADVSVSVAQGEYSHIEEMTKDDNSMTIKANCETTIF